jgi:hypothetical protein
MKNAFIVIVVMFALASSARATISGIRLTDLGAGVTSNAIINNNGEFVGMGLVGGVPHGFVGQIAISPAPSTLALLGVGALVLSILGWRHAARLKALRTMLALVAVLPCLASFARAETLGNHLWNLRQNGQYFFDNNDSWVRPWEFNQDDGYGEFQGGHQGSFPWGNTSTAGNSADGSLSLIRGVDTQFDAWTYLYVPTPATISLTGQGDCVPCWFLNYQFDSPQQFPLGDSASINLSAGWNRLDITGYNQSDGFSFESGALASQVSVMNTSPVPEPSTISGLTSLLVTGVLLRFNHRRSLQFRDSLSGSKPDV